MLRVRQIIREKTNDPPYKVVFKPNYMRRNG